MINDLVDEWVSILRSEGVEINDEYDWLDYIEDDEEIIKDFVGKGYKVIYDESIDRFIVTERRKAVFKNIKMVRSNSRKVVEAIYNSGIHTEFKPVFAFVYNKEIVGGVCYEINEKDYNFDIGIMEEYQGSGVLRKALLLIEKEAKNRGCDYIQAMVVNIYLREFLVNNGYSVYKDSDQIFCIKEIK